jgi:thermostable 8-oxoguanine DNA glycosylase
MKINPREITNYNRTTEELEFFLLFCIVVAGKKSDIQARKLAEWYNTPEQSYTQDSPFEYIERLDADGELRNSLEKVKMGQYNRLVCSFQDVIGMGGRGRMNLRKCSIQDLCLIRGVKLKTSNFFLTHSREDYNVPVLDTHVLKFLKAEGIKNVPKSTPQDEKLYNSLAKQFTTIAKRRRMSVADLDLQVWKQYSKSTIKA